MRWLVVLLIVVGLIIWGGLLEDGAESRAKQFCDSIIVGSLYVEAERRAKASGEDRLRIISENSLTVGFTGIPPFSRHLCEVSRQGDNVSEKQYYYLD